MKHGVVVGLLVAACGMQVASAGMFGPTAYLSLDDSPLDLFGGSLAYFENFEDGVFNIPGVTASTGSVIGPGSNTDSVDEDDGNIDGSGMAGHSFFSASGSVGIQFYFDADVLGQLPTQAGLVWTDGLGTITFTAFDGDGNEIGTLTGDHADGAFGDTTGEDRFYGVEFAAGIGSIFISNESGPIEVDHLQFVVPGPSGLALLGLGGLALRRRR
ncbi:MAG: hypothetical protein DYG94_10500 [Leptolyngbya sp. PLA3]|nr:MAG: hypothetical protein EDM82_09915 [Cyanobacteria bacterium CYA]MCE7969161.1 hypothetical protein [Leptolyngbya sp. PL-A3]